MVSQRFFQAAVFGLLVRPFLKLLLGFNVVHAERVPRRGPALIVANHNSHLDTLALMSLFRLSELRWVRPVAAADHFGGRGLVGFIARHVLRTVLVARDGRGAEAALAPVFDALDRGEILIFFPEGSRGEPETLSRFKRGIAHLATSRPRVPVVPVYLHGMDKSLPKGEALFVPFACAIAVGEPANLAGVPAEAIPGYLQERVAALSGEIAMSRWDDEPGHGLGEHSQPGLNRVGPDHVRSEQS
jgi:1-acyl-sn-glycerol-3-phosphate acyltransferase